MNILKRNISGPDRIPLEIIKTAANVIDSHLPFIINKYLRKINFQKMLRQI